MTGRCCPDDTPIDFDTVLRRGFTPAEALALFQDLSIPLDWSPTRACPPHGSPCQRHVEPMEGSGLVSAQSIAF